MTPEMQRIANQMVEMRDKCKREHGIGYAGRVGPYKMIIRAAMRDNHESNPLVAFERIVSAGKQNGYAMGGVASLRLMACAALDMADEP